MHETGGEEQAGELAGRVARLEAELAAQRDAVQSLREELAQLRNPERASGYLLRPRKPEPASAPPVLTPVPSPPPAAAPVDDPYHWPASATPARPAAPPPIAAARPPAPPASAPAAKPAAVPIPGFIPLPTAAATPLPPQRSLENRIGSQLFNRLGIVALLIGVAYFLKLAIDNHWIHTTPTGRVISGLLLGAGIVLWSERFRRKGYGAFAYSLKAVGSGTLYLALWASFHIYSLLPSWAALILMIGVTAWNAIMALTQDAELLAVYALVGGFATPALLGSSGNHEVFLFTYLLAMDIAVLLLLAKKPWQRLLLGSFPATVGYFIGWYSLHFVASEAGITALFVVLLSAPFVAVALAGEQREGIGEGLLTPLAAGTFLSLAMYSVLQDSGRHSWLPWMAVALAAVYLVLMRLRRNGVAEAVHLVLAITFLTVAIPLKAEGRWITIGWLAEGVALFWVTARVLGPEVQARVRIVMRWMACAALALGVVESVIFWVGQTAAHAFWNGRFATELAAVAALALTAWLARTAAHPPTEAQPTTDLHGAPGWEPIALLAMLGSHAIAVIAVIRELDAYWSASAPTVPGYRDQLLGLNSAAFLTVYGAVLLTWVVLRVSGDTPRRRLLRWMSAACLGFGFIVLLLAPLVSGATPQRVLLNERVAFELIAAIALLVTARMARHAAPATADPKPHAEWPLMALSATLGVHLLIAAAALHEIHGYWRPGLATTFAYREQLHALSMAAFLMVYGAALIAWVSPRKAQRTPAEKRSQQFLATLYLGIGWIITVLTPIVGDGSPTHVFWNARLGLELVSIAALASTAWLAWRMRRHEGEATSAWMTLAAGGLIAFNLLVLLVGVREILTYFGIHAGGDAGFAESFTISAWLMLYAGTLLAVGFWRRMAFVRWQGLGLVVFSIGKVFLYDVRNLSSGYRVLSFVGLGVLLMTVSFAYQKDWLSLREPDPVEPAPIHEPASARPDEAQP